MIARTRTTFVAARQAVCYAHTTPQRRQVASRHRERITTTALRETVVLNIRKTTSN